MVMIVVVVVVDVVFVHYTQFPSLFLVVLSCFACCVVVIMYYTAGVP